MAYRRRYRRFNRRRRGNFYKRVVGVMNNESEKKCYDLVDRSA